MKDFWKRASQDSKRHPPESSPEAQEGLLAGLSPPGIAAWRGTLVKYDVEVGGGPFKDYTNYAL